jgi:hypothetical protein
MPAEQPGAGVAHAPVFGPTIDALLREIEARGDAAEREALRHLTETWPRAEDGAPRDPDALFHRLAALRDTLPAAPPPPGPRRGSRAAALLGLLVGGVVGLPLGFLAYAVARETLLPTSLWSSDAVMWAIVAAVTLACAASGARQGARPTRRGHALRRALLGLLLGAILGGLAIGAAALVIGEVLGVSQREGAFAMGVAFFIVPLSGLLCGVATAIWMGRRAARNWDAAAASPAPGEATPRPPGTRLS